MEGKILGHQVWDVACRCFQGKLKDLQLILNAVPNCVALIVEHKSITSRLSASELPAPCPRVGSIRLGSRWNEFESQVGDTKDHKNSII